MACFICNVHGHWSRECPEATCKFCGDKGHTTNVCKIQNLVKTSSNPNKSLEDIFFENHITYSRTLKEDVDHYVKMKYSKRGMIDSYALCDDVFSNIMINVFDKGHLKVMGYLVVKYCDVSHPYLKEFLRGMWKEYKEEGRRMHTSELV